jgi:serine/threonine protein kinase
MLICPACRTCYEEPRDTCPKDNQPLIVRSPPSGTLDLIDEDTDSDDTVLATGLMIGEYRVEEPIGETELGTTYAAIHPLIRKRVAIRVLNRRYAKDPKAVSRFVTEARAVNEIGHHNIVDIFSIGELWDGRNYLVMELLDGVALHEILKQQGRLEAGQVLPLFEQICDALEAVHAAGFIHRDLRPDKIVVQRRPPHPFVKILDFGLTKLRDGTAEETDVATLVGNPVYMAPEHCRAASIDARADIFSAGVILYELLTGRRPFTDQALCRAFAANEALVPEPLQGRAPVTPELEQVVLKAMAWEPERRFASARELVDHLRQAIPHRLPWAGMLEPEPRAAPPRAPTRAFPPAPQSGHVPAPEAMVGELSAEELEAEEVKHGMMHLRPEPAVGEAGTDRELEDEEPTDIFAGMPAGMAPTAEHDGGQLVPGASLGRPRTLELAADDTEVDDSPGPAPWTEALTPAPDEADVAEPTTRRVSGAVPLARVQLSKKKVTVGPGGEADRPALDDTHPMPAIADAPEPDEVLAAVEPLAEILPAVEPLAEILPAVEPSAEIPPAAEAADGPPALETAGEPLDGDEEPYLSIEISADLAGQSSEEPPDRGGKGGKP